MNGFLGASSWPGSTSSSWEIDKNTLTRPFSKRVEGAQHLTHGRISAVSRDLHAT